MESTEEIYRLDPDAVGPYFRMELPEEEPEPEPEPTETSDLDPRHREDFTGLLYLGRLEEQCTIAGHRFLLRTPGQAERLEMGLIIKPYMNTATVEKAWRLLTVAAYTHQIDSVPSPVPLTAADTALRARFEWILTSITAEPVIELIYNRCRELDARTRDVVEALDGLGEA